MSENQAAYSLQAAGFQGSLAGIQVSNQWARDRKEALQVNRIAGLKRATESYYGQRQ